MAYRFNPPPNWPVNEPGWTPPPGWQPDPSWGPAPDGWDFWVPETDAPAAASQEASCSEQPGADSGSGEPLAPQESPADLDGEPAAPATEQPANAAAFDPDATRQSAATDPSPGTGASGSSVSAHGSPAPAYGSPAPAPAYEQASSPAAGYGQPSPAPAYGQGAPSGQSSPEPGGYGPPSPGYPAGPGMNASASGSAPQWQGSPSGPGGPEKPGKSFLARFWWLGCIILLVLALIIGLIGFLAIHALNSGGDDPSPTTATTATEAPTSDTPTETATETASDDATTDSADAVVTPSVLPTVDAAAPEVAITSDDGKGSMKVSLQWQAADDLEGEYGPIDAPQNGQYLVATIWARADEGTIDLNPFQFTVVTPYGGSIDPATASFSLKDAGLDFDAPDSISAGQEYSIRVIYDIQRNAGLKFQYAPYSGDPATWDVPA